MTTSTTDQTALADTEIRALATEWFGGLNEHRPMVDMLPLLATDGLRMVFPESTLTTMAEFETWYQGVIRLFFDQDHIIRDVTIRPNGSEADVDVVVIWKAVCVGPARGDEHAHGDAGRPDLDRQAIARDRSRGHFRVHHSCAHAGDRVTREPMASDGSGGNR